MTKLLITGFGPFPGAPANPTEALVRALAGEPADALGASALKAVVLKTDYRRSWDALRRLYASFTPDVVVHFGLSGKAEAIHVECMGRNRIDPEKPDAGGYAPKSNFVGRGGPSTLASTFPTNAIAGALRRAGFPAVLSDDAGGYVCNATLYRSLRVAPPLRRVGLIHVPPEERMPAGDLVLAAKTILRHATGF